MLFDPHNPTNTLLRIEVIFNIGSIIYIYIYSFRLNNLVLIFILKKFLIKYHDKISITFFLVCLKKQDLIIRRIFVFP